MHFGRLNLSALQSLKEFVLSQSTQLDLIIASGDWTQRARRSQYREAQDWIKELSTPVLSVPGNHDIPLYNIWARVKNPLKNYLKFLDPLTLSHYQDDEICVVGLNTVNPKVVQDGTLYQSEIDRAKMYFEKAAANKIKILVSHHSLLDLHVSAEQLFDLNPDLVLSGHVHVSSSKTLQHANGHPILHVSAGSAISTRLRGEANSLNYIEIKDKKISVQSLALTEQGFVRPIASKLESQEYGL